MFTSRELALLQTLRSFTADPDFTEWEDAHSDLLHVEANFGSGRRELAIDHNSKHALCDLPEKKRVDAISNLLASAKEWPEGLARVLCTGDRLITPDMRGETDIQIFVDDRPVSKKVQIAKQ